MFDISLAEIVVIMIALLLVVKPEDVPNIVRGLAKAYGKFREHMRDVNDVVDEVVAASGVEEIKQSMTQQIEGVTGEMYEAYDISELDDLADSTMRTEKKEASDGVISDIEKTPDEEENHE